MRLPTNMSEEEKQLKWAVRSTNFSGIMNTKANLRRFQHVTSNTERNTTRNKQKRAPSSDDQTYTSMKNTDIPPPFINYTIHTLYIPMQNKVIFNFLTINLKVFKFLRPVIAEYNPAKSNR